MGRYIIGEIRTGSPNDETLWLPNICAAVEIEHRPFALEKGQ